MRKSLLLLLSLFCLVAKAQSVLVPNHIYFADQHLLVNEGAQREIQRMVDALHKYPKYFQMKVDVADVYFPIIEKVFRQEGLPDDFKYLALQESGLNGEAVSTSYAVGFWQFKKEAAGDYGLRMNQDVDERKHIIESTRSAAKYLIKNNNLYYKNWHNTILSYNLGYTGAKSYARPEDVNKKEMEVTERTHPYILTLLAHKVAFESRIGRNPAPAVMLTEIPVSGKNLSDIALENQIDPAELQKYNKWVVNNYIPSDKTYTVLVPVTNPEQQVLLASQRNRYPAADNRPVADAGIQTTERKFIKINGLKAIIARRGDTKEKLAEESDLSTRKFLALNDMYSFDPIVEGEPYYMQRKKSRAHTQFHVVKQGESVHRVSQKYGVKVKSILWYNRMKPEETLAAGRLLWLQRRRPAHVPVEFQKTYPEAEPVGTPDNPVLLSKDEILDEINSTANVPAQAPANRNFPERSNGTDRVSTTDKANVITDVFTPGAADQNAEEIVTEAAPVDAAIAKTNEVEQKTEEVLSANIDKQVEQINQPQESVLYKRTPKPATNKESIFANADVVLRDPATEPKRDAANTLPQTNQKPVSTVAKEQIAINTPNSTQIPGIHVVAPGETLYAISRKYGITVDNLKTWNNLGETPLAIGQSLKVAIPGNSAAPTKPATSNTFASNPAVANTAFGSSTTHVVSAGESMYQISRRYGVTIKEIMEWNNKADFNVSAGERLVIKFVSSSRN